MKLVAVLSAVVLAGSLAMAADAENSNSTTVDNSKNPITGTKKTVKKHKMKMKDAAGNEADATVKETTKVQKDGTVSKKTTVDADTTKKGE